MEKDKSAAPIIIKKKKGGHHGHHGGAWKVAYADFVTAMMAFFMVMWLMGSDEEVKKAISEYFNNPQSFISASKDGANPFDDQKLNGNQGGLPEDVITKPSKPLPVHIEEHQILMQLGEIFEGSAFSVVTKGNEVRFAVPSYIFFQSGSSKLSFEAQLRLQKLAKIFKEYEGTVTIEGHTNPGSEDVGPEENSWQLSFERAMAIRNYLVYSEKVNSNKLIPVPMGDRHPLTGVPGEDQKNRRVEFILKHSRPEE